MHFTFNTTLILLTSVLQVTLNHLWGHWYLFLFLQSALRSHSGDPRGQSFQNFLLLRIHPSAQMRLWDALEWSSLPAPGSWFPARSHMELEVEVIYSMVCFFQLLQGSHSVQGDHCWREEVGIRSGKDQNSGSWNICNYCLVIIPVRGLLPKPAADISITLKY